MKNIIFFVAQSNTTNQDSVIIDPSILAVAKQEPCKYPCPKGYSTAGVGVIKGDTLMC
jgi:hypothetical protein